MNTIGRNNKNILMTYFKLGQTYASKNNYFNAIEAHLNSLTIDHDLASVLNLGVIYDNIGLEKQAFNQYCIAIQNREKGKINNHLPPFEYTNRAEMYRFMGKSDLMKSDIDKAFSYKKNISQAYKVLARNEIMNCNFELGFEYFTKIIENDATKISSWRQRAEAYMLIGQYDKAITDYKKITEIIKKPVNSIYQIGKCYFESGNKELATEFYNLVPLAAEFKPSYEMPTYHYGIIQYIDIVKGFGFIFGPTWLNSFDSIFFKIKDVETSVKVGEKVRFELSYKKNNNLFKPNAKKIEVWNRISFPNFKKHLTYHGVIHYSQNAFRSDSELKYLYVFYPHNLYYPLDSLKPNINQTILNVAEKQGYVFVEFNLTIDENEFPTFSNIKQIEKENTYSYKFKNNVKQENIDSSSNYWKCNICDGDNETGCLYFDQTECPKHT